MNLHFVCLTERDGRLYELDGNKKQPIDHGKTSKDTFLTVSWMSACVYARICRACVDFLAAITMVGIDELA